MSRGVRSEIIFDRVNARQRELQLECLFSEEILEPWPRPIQHLIMDEADQGAIVAPIEVAEAIFPGVRAEQRRFLLAIGVAESERHVARIGNALIGKLLCFFE